MKRIPLLLLLGMFCFALPLQAKPKRVVIKLATLAPKGTTWANHLYAMAKEVKEATQGRVKFRIYPGGVMGEEPDVLNKMRSGQLHAGVFTGVILGEIFPDSRVLELPLLFKSYEEVDYVRDRLLPDLQKGFMENGYHLLGLFEIGNIYIYTNKAVHNLEELRGVKMWAYEGDKIQEKLFELAKFVPVFLPVTDVRTALQTGLINACFAPPLVAVSFQWDTKVKFYADPPLVNGMAGALITKKRWDRISPEDQKIIMEIAARHQPQIIKDGRRDNKESLEKMRENGVERVAIDSKGMADLQKICDTMREELTGSYFSKGMMDHLFQLLDEYRAKHP